MRAKTILALAVACVCSAVALAQSERAMEAAKQQAATVPVFKSAADLKWTDLDPSSPGSPKIADVWGDHTKGAFGAFVKAPAGWTTPLHTHTNAFKIIIISGTFLQTPEMKTEMRMGPGSYVAQPGGNYKHVSGCDKASECVFFVQSEGKFDLRPVGPPAKK
jgi:hypothetical protein